MMHNKKLLIELKNKKYLFIFFVLMCFFCIKTEVSRAQYTNCSSPRECVIQDSTTIYNYDLMTQVPGCPTGQICVQKKEICREPSICKSIDNLSPVEDQCANGTLFAYCGLGKICCQASASAIQEYSSKKIETQDEALKNLNDEYSKKIILKDCIQPTNSINLEVPMFGAIKVLNLADYLRIVFRFGVYIIGIVLVIVLIFSGFQWLLAGGNESAISNAKERIRNGVMGLVLLSCSYLILYTINPSLVSVTNPVICKLLPETVYGGLSSLYQKHQDEYKDCLKRNISCQSEAQCNKPCERCVSIVGRGRICAPRQEETVYCDDGEDCAPGLICDDNTKKCGVSIELSCQHPNSQKGDRCFGEGIYPNHREPGYCGKEKDPVTGLISVGPLKCLKCMHPRAYCDDDFQCEHRSGVCGNYPDPNRIPAWNTVPKLLWGVEGHGVCGSIEIPLIGGLVDKDHDCDEY